MAEYFASKGLNARINGNLFNQSPSEKRCPSASKFREDCWKLNKVCFYFISTIFIICTTIRTCETAVPSVYDSLYKYVLDGYNQDVLPILTYGENVNISVRLFIISLNDYDQISGELSMTLVFILSWDEKRIQWDASGYNNLTSIQIPIKKLWTPLMFAREVSKSIEPLGPLTTMVEVQNTGLATWSFGEILKITCSPDVTYFPFDRQQCAISFSLGNGGNSEVSLYPINETLEKVYFSTNSQWEILQSPIKSEGYTLSLSLNLERRTTFYVVYIIIPVILLGLINNLVLVLPSTSGERMSVAITTFLSFIVYMDIVNSNVPESSAPVPYIYYYLLLLMLYSAIIMIFCIVSMRIRDKETKVPRVIERIVLFARLRCLKTPKHTVSPEASPKKITNESKETHYDNGGTDVHVAEIEVEEHNTNTYEEPVTWKTVSETLDIYCTLCLILIYTIVTAETFVKLRANEGL